MIHPSTIQYFRQCPNYHGIRRYVAARWNVLAAGESEGHGHCRLSCAPEPKSRLLQGPGEEIEGKSFLHAPLQMRGGWRRSNQINSTGVALFVNGVIHISFFSGSGLGWVLATPVGDKPPRSIIPIVDGVDAWHPHRRQYREERKFFL